MNKETFIQKITDELEKMKIANRKNFLNKSFVSPNIETDAELTLNGAQIAVVISDSINMKYKFYKVDEKYLKDDGRKNIIQKIKEQYPGIIFYICKSDNNDSPKTIDTEHNMIVFENENFDAAVELCGGTDKFMSTMI